MTTVNFCGHCSLTEEDRKIVEKNLQGIIEKFILLGAKDFLLGTYGEFDVICAKTVRELKKRYPHITSILFLPCEDVSYNRRLYDYVVRPIGVVNATEYDISRINEAMVNRADAIVAYINNDKGTAARTYVYAKNQNKLIINIADEK